MILCGSTTLSRGILGTKRIQFKIPEFLVLKLPHFGFPEDFLVLKRVHFGVQKNSLVLKVVFLASKRIL